MQGPRMCCQCSAVGGAACGVDGGVAMTDHVVVIAGRSDWADAGRRVGVGGDRRRHRRTTRGSRGRRIASRSHHSRTIEVLDQHGIPERFLSAGQVMQVAGFAGISLDISDFPTRHNYGLALWQSEFEPILADWVGELGVPTIRGCEVLHFAQDDDGVDVELSGDTSLHAEYLVGCDGGRSQVRKAAGIDFAGSDASTSWMIAEVEMDGEPRDFGARPRQRRPACARPTSSWGADPGRAHRTRRRPCRRPQHGRAARGARRRSRDGLWAAQRQLDLQVHGHDAPGSRLSPRPCTSGRGRRHVHPPHGGQGLNIGVQDAVNLGGSLAQVVTKTSPGASWTPTTPNGIQSVPECCATRWRRWR